jgi:hypothetical protein
MNTSKAIDVVQAYLDASYESDVEKMSQVFHDDAHILGHNKKGLLSDMNKQAFLELVKSSAPGSSDPNFQRQDNIISIDITSEHTAVARVEVRIGNILFTDILCLIYLEGEWFIISKVYSGKPLS